MDILEVQAQPRQDSGTSASRRLRRQGLLPAVMYGHGEGSVALTLDRAAITHAINEHQLILKVTVGGEEQNVQIKDLQFDHLGSDIIHVDLVRINLDEKITVSVPVEVHGDARGVEEEGGVLEIQMHAVSVECLPTDIPENITVDVTDLGMHDSVTVEDLVVPEGVVILESPEQPVVVIAAPTEEVEEEEEGLEEPGLAEPEVIGRVAEEEEEGEEE